MSGRFHSPPSPMPLGRHTLDQTLNAPSVPLLLYDVPDSGTSFMVPIELAAAVLLSNCLTHL